MCRRVEGMVMLLELGDIVNRGNALLMRVLRMGGADDDNSLTNALIGEAAVHHLLLHLCTTITNNMSHNDTKGILQSAAL
jgi:hypothetical protein